MVRTLKDSEMRYAVGVVTKTVEPRVKTLVEELNKFLKSKGIRAGVELQWYFDGISPADNERGKENESEED